MLNRQKWRQVNGQIHYWINGKGLDEKAERDRSVPSWYGAKGKVGEQRSRQETGSIEKQAIIE